MLDLIALCFVYASLGALIGLLPYFLCKSQGKPNLGCLSLMLCMVSGLLTLFGLSVIIAIAFSIVAFTAARDCRPILGTSSTPSVRYHSPAPVYYNSPRPAPSNRLGLVCLSGPMYGRTYRLGSGGIMIGRDSDCAVRFYGNAPGISRHHCSVRMSNGRASLVDHGSSYGSYLADGTQLPPNYPMPLQPGSRFYVGSSMNMFELVVMR